MGAPYPFLWPVIRQQYSVRRSLATSSGSPEGQAANLSICGLWPWGGKSPLAALVLIARSPVPGHPEKSQTFWGEEEQRSDCAFAYVRKQMIRSLLRRSLCAPAARLPALARSRRYSVVERINSPHIPRTKNIQMRGYITKLFSNISSCSPIHISRTRGQSFRSRFPPEQPPGSSCRGLCKRPHVGPAFWEEN